MRGEVDVDRDAESRVDGGEDEPDEDEIEEAAERGGEGEEEEVGHVAGGGIGGGRREGSEDENKEEEENVEVSVLKDMFIFLLLAQTQAHRKYARGVQQSKDQGGIHTVKWYLSGRMGMGMGEEEQGAASEGR